jgi:HSP20 family molecular chaperone IbpA
MDVLKRLEEGMKALYSLQAGTAERMPDVDIYDTGDGVAIYIDMPGFKKESIKVRVYERAVEIAASPPQRDSQAKPLRQERISNFAVSRRVELPFRLRIDSAKAVYRDGVLQVTVAKAGEYSETAEVKID